MFNLVFIEIIPLSYYTTFSVSYTILMKLHNYKKDTGYKQV